MTNPLALLPLAIAAGGGRISAAGDSADFEAQSLGNGESLKANAPEAGTHA